MLTVGMGARVGVGLGGTAVGDGLAVTDGRDVADGLVVGAGRAVGLPPSAGVWSATRLQEAAPAGPCGGGSGAAQALASKTTRAVVASLMVCNITVEPASFTAALRVRSSGHLAPPLCPADGPRARARGEELKLPSHLLSSRPSCNPVRATGRSSRQRTILLYRPRFPRREGRFVLTLAVAIPLPCGRGTCEQDRAIPTPLPQGEVVRRRRGEVRPCVVA
jgi:hypothetical protein